MSRRTPNQAPLDQPALERLALRYVERFATSRAKLVDYLRRKLRERGGADPHPDPDAVADQMVRLGYVDDRAFADARSTALSRRGMGGRRIDQALRQAGIADDLRTEMIQPFVEDAQESALVYARKRRFGPFSPSPADPDRQRRQIAAMVRAGHEPRLAAQIVRARPGDERFDPVDNA